MKVYALFEVTGDDYKNGVQKDSRIYSSMFLNKDDAVKELCCMFGCWYIKELEVQA